MAKYISALRLRRLRCNSSLMAPPGDKWDCEALLKRLLILLRLCWVSHRSPFARAIFARPFDGDGGVLHGWITTFGRRLDLIPVWGNEGIFFAKLW
jgi:hypothetical protein